MAQIKLYDGLREKYGESFDLDIRSPREAIQALKANFKDFEQTILTTSKEYRVIVDNSDIGIEDIGTLVGKKSVIKIVPVIAGAKEGGLFQIIVGVALIWATGGFGTAGLAALQGTAIGTTLGGLGVSLLLGGITSLLFSPSAQKPPERAENTPNDKFNGVVNTTAQGHPVPIGYGRLRIGSAVISAGLSSDNQLYSYSNTTVGSMT